MKTTTSSPIVRRLIESVCLGLFAISISACAARAPQAVHGLAYFENHKQKIDQPAIASPLIWTLPNNLKVVFMEDAELPLVTGTLYLPGGTLNEKPDQIGMFSALGDQMRSGGAGNLNADRLDELLESLSASISSSYGAEFGVVSFACLSSDLKTVFPIFSDVVQAPRFEEARLKLWQGQALEGIRRRGDDPNTVAGLSLRRLIFGDQIFGRVSKSSDIARINRSALMKLHEQFVKPSGAVLVVTGRLTSAELEKLVAENFSKWDGRVPNLAYAYEAPKPRPGIYFIEQPLEQATELLGELGPGRHSPDEIKLDLFSTVFGSSGFGSLLNRRVRTELGLAYGVYGGSVVGPKVGRNLIMVQTKAASSANALAESLNVLKQMQGTPVTDAELDEAKNSIAFSYVFNFDTPGKVARRVVELSLLGYPPDYDVTYLPNIIKLSPHDITQVANRDWDSKRFSIVVVGNQRAYQVVEAATKDVSSPLFGMALKRVHFDETLKES